MSGYDLLSGRCYGNRTEDIQIKAGRRKGSREVVIADQPKGREPMESISIFDTLDTITAAQPSPQFFLPEYVAPASKDYYYGLNSKQKYDDKKKVKKDKKKKSKRKKKRGKGTKSHNHETENNESGKYLDEEAKLKAMLKRTVKIRGFKDIGYDKVKSDLLSICWSNNSEKCKKLLDILDKVDPKKIGVNYDSDEDGDDNELDDLLKGGGALGDAEDMDIADVATSSLTKTIKHHDLKSPYKVDPSTKTFGRLKSVSMNNVDNEISYTIPAKEKGSDILNVKIKLDRKAFVDLEDLLTKRIKKSYKYEHEAIGVFTKMVNESNLERRVTAKLKLVDEFNAKATSMASVPSGGALMGSGEYVDLGDKNASSAPQKTTIDNDVMIMRPVSFKSGSDRLSILVSEIKGGNGNKDLKDELKLVYKYLWEEANKNTKHKAKFDGEMTTKYKSVFS